MTHAAAVLRDYRSMIKAYGEPVVIRRQPASDYTVHARLVTDDKAETIGVKQSSKRRFLIVAPDLAATGFPLPIQTNKDRILWAGRELPITGVNETTRRVGGTLIAYEIDTAGA